MLTISESKSHLLNIFECAVLFYLVYSIVTAVLRTVQSHFTLKCFAVFVFLDFVFLCCLHLVIKVEKEVWATILPLIWLHGFKSNVQDEWELLAMKAASWLRAQKGNHHNNKC